MDKQKNPSLKHLLGVAFFLIAVSVSAQKLPNIQERSVRAPAGIKIDGKRPEWDNKVEAINNRELYL